MTTLADLKRRILYLLEDPLGEGYSNEIIIDGIVSAFDAILPWVSKAASTNITGNGTAVAFTLPSGLYDVEAVVISDTGLVIPKAVFFAGGYHGENIDAENNWMLFPDGYITFSKIIGSGAVYNLYYYAQWTKPDLATSVTTVLEPPDYAMTGIAYYAASYALLPTSVSTAEVRQYGTRVDSGHPEHNPIQKSVQFLQALFLQEMNRLPKRPRGTT